MKNKLTIWAALLFTCFGASFIHAAPGAAVDTQSAKLSLIRVQVYQGKAYYYFAPVGGPWVSTGCGNSSYAYIEEDSVGAKAILSVSLSARAAGMPVKFSGTCGNDSGNTDYVKITNIHL